MVTGNRQTRTTDAEDGRGHHAHLGAINVLFRSLFAVGRLAERVPEANNANPVLHGPRLSQLHLISLV
jgi:hypothetical protein